MSIKNIIQQENDLQEMSPRSLANYLNNPTGQYNPYLVAGELQRKEAFAQRQMTEAPQETVVDELVAQAMPMGGMPMGGMPMGGMSMPRPQEAMVSDTITETGIANLPAPNIGQNYAEGGIIGYDNGGEVGFFDRAKSQFYENVMGTEEERAIEQDQRRRAQEYQEKTGKYPVMNQHLSEEERIIADENMLNLAFGVGGIGAIKNTGKAAAPYIKDAAKKGLDYIKNKIKPQKLTKAEKAAKVKADKAKVKADKAAQKVKDKDTRTVTQKIKDKAKELYGSTSSDKGVLSRTGIAGLKGIGQGAGPLTRAVGRGLKNYPVEAGLGAYGAYKAYDYFDPFGTKQKEAEETLAQENKASMEMHRQTRLRREANERVQAQLDADKAARDRQREKEAYLALALGGAKTMAGQSPFALANIGEGLGAGVGALAAYDQNEMERMVASQAATAKAQQDMKIALMNYEMKYYERVNKLADNEIYNARLKQIEDNEEGLVDEDVAKLKEALLIEFAGLDPKSYIAKINGQQFTAVE